MKYRKHLGGLLVALGIVTMSVPVTHADTLTVGASKDNTLYEDPNGAFSNGAGGSFYAGRTAQAANYRRRGLIAFNVNGIPAGSLVTQASVTLTVSRTSDLFSRAMTLHRVTADWGEGTSVATGSGGPSSTGDATWKHRFFNTLLWSTPGGDFVAESSAKQEVGDVGSYTWGSTTQLVADVQGWVDTPNTNFGWLVLGDESKQTTTRQFESRTSGATSDRPSLSITYTPPITVTGTITLLNFQKGASLTFEFRPTGAAKFQRTVAVAANGSYSIPNIPRRNYKIWIKGSRWLAKTVSADLTNQNLPVSATLIPGDANNDNSVNIFDLGTLAESFNTGPNDTNWNEECDFNGDDSVDIFDLAGLAESFNQDGDL